MTPNQTLVRPWIGLAFLFLGFAGGALAQSNFPPAVQIVTPFNGATFRAPVNIAICAAARDRDGHVVSVEFFAGSDSLGIKTNGLCLVWSNAPAGEYSLTAKATDDHGA